MLASDMGTYFTNHLFQAGLECPTKLHYKAESYPENRKSQPFIEHAIYNSRLLKSLLRSGYPEGEFIEYSTAEEASNRTRELLEDHSRVLFDAIFTYKNFTARVPVVEKSGNRIKVYQVGIKAFGSKKKTLFNHSGKIKSKWRDYLLSFAYKLYVIRRIYPDSTLIPMLVLPDKKGVSGIGDLHYKLFTGYRSENIIPDIPQSEQDLLAILDVSEQIDHIWYDESFARANFEGRSFEEILHYLCRVYVEKEKVPPVTGSKCKHCEFRIESERVRQGESSGFNACWRDHLADQQTKDTSYHVFELIGPGTQKWINRGTYDQRNISADEITAPQDIVEQEGKISEKMRQSLQIAKAGNKVIPSEIIRPNLLEELKRWRYPIHFLDFEAGNYAVPVRSGRKPYHLVVFQYSCHTLLEDGSWKHYEWLDDQKSGYPNYELIRQLRRIPSFEEGTIVQYSNFERNAMKIIRRELQSEEAVPDAALLSEWIAEIISRYDSNSLQPPYLADLSRLVKNYYYNNRMTNSLSIKDVLQSVLSYSSFLQDKYTGSYSGSNFDHTIWWQSDGNGEARNPYQILTEESDITVRRGTEAMVVYGKMLGRDMNYEDLERYRKSLYKYCELDTLAMMMIFEHWREKSLNINES